MFRYIELPAEIPGKLYLHSMPGRFEPLEETQRSIQAFDIRRVVCLTPAEEIWRKSPSYACLLEAKGYNWQQEVFPIQDFSVPEDRDAYLELARRLAGALKSGENLLVHCAGGVGRTGTLATVILVASGMNELEAQQAVEMAGSGPENEKQKALVAWCVGRLHQA